MKGLSRRLTQAFGADAQPRQTLGGERDLSMQAVLDAAVQSHQRESLADAERGYRMVLQREPQNAKALYLLGVVQLQKGDPAAANDLLGRALAIDPSNANAYMNLAAAQRALGRLTDAELNLRQAITYAPDSDRAHNDLGILLVQQGRIDAARTSFSQALAIRPDSIEALNNLANSSKDAGELAHATELYRRAITLDPRFAEAHSNLGGVQYQQGQLDEAERSYRQAITLKPTYPEAWNGLGIVLAAMHRFNDAEECFWKALEHRADFVEALSNLGDVLVPLDRFEEAEACCRRALSIRPTDPEALNNLGTLLRRTGRIDEAENCFREAVAQNPKHVRSYVNLATIQRELHPDDAEASLRTALALDPDNAPARYNLATTLLSRGEYRSGFAHYESRFGTATREYANSRGLYEQLKEAPWWRGEPLSGRRLLVWTEQGFGDSLMTMRYLPMLEDRGARSIVVACDAPLRRVMQAMPGVADVVASDRSALPAFDVHCSIMSLPHLFQTEFDAVPCAVPYLRTAEKLRAAWIERLAGPMDRKVGIAWAGSKTLRDDLQRSLVLSQLAPLLAVKGVRWISLQKDDADADGLDATSAMEKWISECDDFMDTAALVDCLDLVISVDTAVVHLAGALGKPVWLLNRCHGDWRWGHDGEASAWYPTLRQFRQQRRGQWGGAIQRAAEQLESLLR